MAEQGQRRKLSAILSADVVGYSRLMQDDDAATVETVTKYRSVFSDFVSRHDGRIVDSPGDNILAEFDSPVEAVQCAVELQREFARRNRQLAQHRQMQFRMGINLGDILSRDDGTIYGDGVNVAARLESLADPGGIMISESAQMQVRSLIDVSVEDAGEHEVKNIAQPVRVYRIELNESAAVPHKRRKVSRALIVAATAVALVIAILVVVGPQSERQPEDSVLALPDGPAIAVLPFENLSDDPEQEYFSDGLTEDIITRLTRFPRFFVIARNSTSQYKGQSVDVRQVGRDLGARYVVEGSVRKSGDSIRVTAQLIDAKNGTHMWAETFDRDLTAADLFAVQDEITEEVAATISDDTGVINRAEIEALKRKPTDSMDAYECVLRAIEYYDGIGPDAHLVARDCLERAVKLDPNYADAWGALAFTYLDEFRFGFNTRDGARDRALDAALRSVELDANGEWGEVSLAEVHFARSELDAFFAAADRAIANNPNHATNLAAMGDKIFAAGQFERGHAMVEKAVSLNPNHAGWYNFVLGLYPYLNGDYETALTFALKIQMPEFFANHMFLAATYGQLGKAGEAEAAKEKLLELVPNFPVFFHEFADIMNWPDEMKAAYIDGLRKAGLDVVERPPAIK